LNVRWFTYRLTFMEAMRRAEVGAEERDGLFTVTELARDLGVTARTIRFYEDKGLIAPQRAGSTRVYTVRDRARMILILRGKRLGFTLREIKEYLDLYGADVTQGEQLRLLLKAVQARIGRLEEQRTALEQTMTELKGIESQALAALRGKVPHRRKAAAPAWTG
jgi:DNA-binding transcriptional MerR regulator